jgi:hypothetical protein
MDPPKSLTDLPDDLLIPICTYVADTFDFDDTFEKSIWDPKIFAPLKLPVPALMALSKTSRRFYDLVKPLLYRTFKLNSRADCGSISTFKLLNMLMSSEGLSCLTKKLWRVPWKPSHGFDNLQFFHLQEAEDTVPSSPLPSVEKVARSNLAFLQLSELETLIQHLNHNKEDALRALLLSSVTNLETLELVAWLPSFAGHVFELLTHVAEFYKKAPRNAGGKDYRSFGKLRRVTFHDYCWNESFDDDAGSEGWSEHEEEIAYQTLPIEKVVPFFHLPSMRVLQCKNVTSHNTDYSSLGLRPGCSRIEHLTFDQFRLDDTALRVLIRACKGPQSFHLWQSPESLTPQLITYPGLGQALQSQAATLTKLHIHIDNLYHLQDMSEERSLNIGTIGSSLLTLTKLRDLEVCGSLLWGYHPESVLASETRKNSPLIMDVSRLVILADILPMGLERLCVIEWYANIAKGMEDFARVCGRGKLFGEMRSLEVGIGNTKVLEKICREGEVGFVKHTERGRSGIW